MSNALLEKIRSTENLPSLPTVALEVLNLSRRDDVSVNDLASVIQNDPSLTAKILKVVNSPLFGIPREISSLKQAVNMLGLRTVKVMALSLSLVETVSRAKVDGLDFTQYWRRSLTTAVGSRLLAKAACPTVTEEVFVAGLLADIGMIAAWRAAPAVCVDVCKAWHEGGSSQLDAECQILGCSHARLSAGLLRAWGLPENICDAVESHQGEELATRKGTTQKMASIIACAAKVADLFENDTPSHELFSVKEYCCGALSLAESQLDEVLSAITNHVKETASFLNVQIGDTIQYAQLQQDAALQLARLSMQAEMDRVESLKRESVVREEAHRLNEEKRAILEVASTDGLTKVANRAAFDKRLDEEVRRAGEYGQEIGLIMMDVDHFKRFNDTHGHQAGDEVLRMVGECLRDVVKSTGYVARYGGEEFAVMLVGEAARQIRNLAEEIRQTLEARQVRINGATLSVTASFGTATAMPNTAACTTSQLVQTADQRLYQSKRAGRNRVS